MKKYYFLVLMILSFACENTEIGSSSLSGYYETNALLDASCIALPPENMPRVTISAAAGDAFTFKHEGAVFDPMKQKYVMVSRNYENITTSEDVRGTVFTYKGKELGYFGIPATYTGKEKTKRLWIRYEEKESNTNFYFVGEKK